MCQDDVEVLEESLAGAVINVLDKDWGFNAVGRAQHPGACIFYFAAEKFVTLVRGTDYSSRTARRFTYFRDVYPDESNGLDKPTRFELAPYRKKARKVRLWAKDRRRGTLSKSDLFAMQKELQRIFPEECGARP